MKISLNWLRRYVDVDWDAQTIADRLTAAGLEIEDITYITAGFSGVRVGFVEAVRQHPNADRLRLATVRVGDETHEVVCGAPNCRAGLTVAYAGLGAVLPGDFKIKRAKIRGVESLGMLCSEKELGLGAGDEGIAELPADLTLGAPLTDVWPIEDAILDAGVTANRGDCLSHLGVARELAALAGVPLRRPDVSLPEQALDAAVSVTIQAPARCGRYVGRVAQGVTVCQSPFWMRRLLESVGVRPINNVVDVTNFVLFEYGQPLHAFDLRDLAGARIDVRLADDGEQLTTLDGEARTLSAHDLLICDAARPVALAGIMGGENSEVKDDTTALLIEAAWFEPTGIRETARRLGVRSESSHRFERAVDPTTTAEAAARALHLLASLPGGEALQVSQVVSEAYGDTPAAAVIEYRPGEADRRLGFAVPADVQRVALERFGFAVTVSGDTWAVQVPTFRNDVAEGADLVEEVMRFVGYDKVPAAEPRLSLRGQSTGLERRRRQRHLEGLLGERGFHQALNYSFIRRDQAERFGTADPVALINPLTEDLAVLRGSLMPGLLANAVHNLRHGARSVCLFESGKVFQATSLGEQPIETPRLGLLIAGEAARHWKGGARPADFYDIKGLCDDLLAAAGVAGGQWVAAAQPGLHPGATAACVVGDARVAIVGSLHPATASAEGLTQPVFLAEIDLEPLIGRDWPLPRFADFSRQPAVRRDLAVVLPAGVSAGQVLAQIEELGIGLVDKVEVFDVYEGGELRSGERSLGVSLTYRDAGRTLTDDDVSAAHERVTNHLASSLGATQR